MIMIFRLCTFASYYRNNTPINYKLKMSGRGRTHGEHPNLGGRGGYRGSNDNRDRGSNRGGQNHQNYHGQSQATGANFGNRYSHPTGGGSAYSHPTGGGSAYSYPTEGVYVDLTIQTWPGQPQAAFVHTSNRHPYNGVDNASNQGPVQQITQQRWRGNHDSDFGHSSNRNASNNSRDRGSTYNRGGAGGRNDRPPTQRTSAAREPTGSTNNFQDNDEKRKDDFKKNEPQGSKREKLWMGVPFGHLKRAPECLKENMSSNEKVDSPDEKIPPIPPPYVRWGEIAKPTGNDHSMDNYVSMPHLADAKNSERNYSSYRWERIKSVLQYETPHNSLALEKVIKSYGSHHWKFDILHQYFEIMDPQIANTFFEETLPKIQELALKLPELFTEPLNILKQKRNMEIHLTQQQVACLLANAFFCTFPESNPKSKGGQVSGINFNTLYGDPRSSHRKIEKLRCIINYFQRVTKNMPNGTVTYARQCVQLKPDFWSKTEKKLTNLHVSVDGTIEDVGIGMLQADFANKFVGGGVLNNGLVQEEIRFVICPELILSRLFTETLVNNDVLIVTGCERFSNYVGYSDTFIFNGNHEDNTKRDKWGRKYTEVVAMDALVFRDDYSSQFLQYQLFRELSKAFCAFKGKSVETGLPAVCTGNWGCGAFGGDKQLKALIQIMAASAVDRDVCYLTFSDYELCAQIGHMHQLLKDKELSIKDIVGLILDYGKKLNSSVKMKASLFNYIEEKVSPKSKITEKKRSIDEEFPKDNRGEKMSSFKRRRKVKTNLNCFSHTRRT